MNSKSETGEIHIFGYLWTGYNMNSRKFATESIFAHSINPEICKICALLTCENKLNPSGDIAAGKEPVYQTTLQAFRMVLHLVYQQGLTRILHLVYQHWLTGILQTNTARKNGFPEQGRTLVSLDIESFQSREIESKYVYPSSR